MNEKHLRETRLTTETIFKGKLLHVVRDDVRLPDGRTSVREGIHHQGAVVVIPLLDRDTVIMERQYRYMPDQIFYELPAGKKDPGEDDLTTGQRELLEETGYTAARWTFISHLYPAIGYADEKMAIYLAEELTLTQPNRDMDEFLEVIRMPLSEALALLQQGKITDAKTMVGLFWADKLRRGEWEPRG